MTAKQIKEIRTKSLLTQQEFASELGLNVATIQKWEQGRGEISFKNQRKIKQFCLKYGIEV